jgi:hypothetical protein
MICATALYDWLLPGHILAAMLWVGGAARRRGLGHGDETRPLTRQ